MKNIAINGFGRIGRLLLREVINRNITSMKVVSINDLCSIDAAIHLLKYDTVHKNVDFSVSQKSSDEILIVKKNPLSQNENINHVIKFTSFSDPNFISLDEIDVLCECTGKFTTKNAVSKFIEKGAKKILISAPSIDADFTVVYGVNHTLLPQNAMVISNASCTTNCLAPVIMVLDKEFGIQTGFMSTVHSYTADQKIIDTFHKDLRRARAGCENIIPTTTGATKAIEKIFPHLKDKINGISYRVPTPNVSLVDFTFISNVNIKASDINLILKDASSSYLKGVLGIESLPLVSSDYIGNRNSAIIDESLTSVLNENFGHVVAWYDNECGFANRMIDVALML